jgi:hypothetical protein
VKRPILRRTALGVLAASVLVPASATAVDLPQIPALPTVTVLGPNSAKLEAVVHPAGQPLAARYDCGTAGLPSVSTPVIDIAGGIVNPTAVTGTLLNLAPNRNYQCRLVLDSPGGQVVGGAFSFSTPSGPTLINPVTGAPVQTPRGAARCTITGTARADRLKGTKKRDVICGLGGNDRISGGRGADLVYGGAGKDRVKGGRGKDRLYGNAGRDRLIASDDRRGGDRVNGGPARDTARLDRGDRVVAVESVAGR